MGLRIGGWGFVFLALAGPVTASSDVVVSHSILSDWVREVAGPEVSVRGIVGPNEDAHSYEPTPDDVRALGKARVLIYSGAHFEPWLPGLIRSSKTAAKTVDLSSYVVLRYTAGAVKEPDPHYWNDVRNAQSALSGIRKALAEAFPAQADQFAKRENQYAVRLGELDKWVRSSVQSLTPDRRKIVTSHDSIGYWADAYGFRVVGSAFGSITTESADPSALHIRELVDAVRAEKVQALFVENFGNPGLVRRVADEAGVRLAPPLYTDSLSRPDGPAPTYVDLIRYNTRTIVEALSQ